MIKKLWILAIVVCVISMAGCIEVNVPPPTPVEEVVDTLSIKMIDESSGEQVSSDGSLLVFLQDADPSRCMTSCFVEVQITNGMGQADMSDTGLRTFTLYKFVSQVEGYYDKSVSTVISNNPSIVTYLHKIGTFEELLITNATDGSVNGQTDTTNPYNEIRVIDENTICYNKSNGDGRFHLVLNIGAFGNNEYLKNPVIYTSDTVELYTPAWCVWSIQAERYRGSSDVCLPYDIYRDSAYSISPESEYMMSGTYAQYEFVFTILEESCGQMGSFDIIVDDLDGGVDVRGGAGADAKRLRIVFEE